MAGRACTVCGHARSHRVNVALVSRESYRAISRQYGLSKDALRRHAQEHIPGLLARARDAAEVADAGDLLKELEEIRSHLRSLVALAAKDGKYGSAIQGESVLLKRVELLARVRQLIDDRPQVNILIHPAVQRVIIDALRPFPAAGVAVADALDGVKELEAPEQ